MNDIINTLNLSMQIILSKCQKRLSEEKSSFSLKVMDPTPWIDEVIYDGAPTGENQALFRSIKTWAELAEVLECRLGVPERRDDHLIVTLYPLNGKAWRASEGSEKDPYSPDGSYASILKTEDPHWLNDYQLALKQCRIIAKSKILSLGVNRGDELKALQSWYSEDFETYRFTGYDISADAIRTLKQSFKVGLHHFETRDLSDGVPPEMERQDLMICLSTLQCTNMDGKEVFRHWFQKALSPRGNVILGFPNCSWLGGELIYGAKMRNQPHPDPSLLMKDLMYFKKYLQTHKKRVSVLGKHSLFLVGSAIES